MPELPEVQTVVNELDKNLKNKSIIEIDAVFEPIFNDDYKPVLNLKIESVTRRAKYIVYNFFDTDIHLISHLRMTGKYLFNDVPEKEEKFIRAIFKISDGTTMYYLDMRKFGKFDVTCELKNYFKNIGVEPLGKDLNYQYLEKLINKTIPIKTFLLDQSFIAGIGNIYADEVLFLSKIHPQRKTNSLNKTETELLIKNIKKVLKSAVENMGTRLSDYRDTDKGENQNYLNVYGRENRECKVCKSKIVKIKSSGRGTHYCPQCQII